MFECTLKANRTKSFFWRGLFSIVVFCDLSKAFDVIKRPILFEKMKYYGINGAALHWVEHYFKDRSQRIKLGEKYSDNKTIELGVGQGSILGPLVLCLMINDLYKVCKYCKLLGYADETTLYHSYHNLLTLYERIKHDVKVPMTWFNANRMCLNTAKTKFMIFSKNNVAVSNVSALNVSDCKIERVEHCKLLGMWLDQKLNWQYHVDRLIVKLKQGMFSLHSTTNLLPTFVRLRLYYSFIYSHLSYGIEIWGNSVATQSQEKLQKIQNTCIILLLKCNTSTYGTAFHQNWNLLVTKVLVNLIKIISSCNFTHTILYILHYIFIFVKWSTISMIEYVSI